MVLVVFRVKISSSLGRRSRGSPDSVKCVMLTMVGILAGLPASFSFPNLGIMAVSMRFHAQRSLYIPRAEVNSSSLKCFRLVLALSGKKFQTAWWEKGPLLFEHPSLSLRGKIL